MAIQIEELSMAPVITRTLTASEIRLDPRYPDLGDLGDTIAVLDGLDDPDLIQRKHLGALGLPGYEDNLFFNTENMLALARGDMQTRLLGPLEQRVPIKQVQLVAGQAAGIFARATTAVAGARSGIGLDPVADAGQDALTTTPVSILKAFVAGANADDAWGVIGTEGVQNYLRNVDPDSDSNSNFLNRPPGAIPATAARPRFLSPDKNRPVNVVSQLSSADWESKLVSEISLLKKKEAATQAQHNKAIQDASTLSRIPVLALAQWQKLAIQAEMVRLGRVAAVTITTRLKTAAIRGQLEQTLASRRQYQKTSLAVKQGGLPSASATVQALTTAAIGAVRGHPVAAVATPAQISTATNAIRAAVAGAIKISPSNVGGAADAAAAAVKATSLAAASGSVFQAISNGAPAARPMAAITEIQNTAARGALTAQELHRTDFAVQMPAQLSQTNLNKLQTGAVAASGGRTLAQIQAWVGGLLGRPVRASSSASSGAPGPANNLVASAVSAMSGKSAGIGAGATAISRVQDVTKSRYDYWGHVVPDSWINPGEDSSNRIGDPSLMKQAAGLAKRDQAYSNASAAFLSGFGDDSTDSSSGDGSFGSTLSSIFGIAAKVGPDMVKAVGGVIAATQNKVPPGAGPGAAKGAANGQTGQGPGSTVIGKATGLLGALADHKFLIIGGLAVLGGGTYFLTK